MFRTWIKRIRNFLKQVSESARQRRQRRLAEIAAMEKRERKALVKELSKKFEDAHADCEQNDKTVTVIELSLKEIIFIEWDLKTWSRYFKESEIYEVSPQT